jgi:hypothetical protein
MEGGAAADANPDDTDEESEGWGGQATQLDILLALQPDLAICDIANGEFLIEGRPLYINDFEHIECVAAICPTCRRCC